MSFAQFGMQSSNIYIKTLFMCIIELFGYITLAIGLKFHLIDYIV